MVVLPDLSAARRITELDPTAKVVLLEAECIGEGPSGRNSGFMIDLPHSLSASDYAGDQAQDKKHIRMNRAAIEFLKDSVDTFEFPEESFKPIGKINAAATAKGDKHNLDYAKHLEFLNEPYELLSKSQMQQITGGEYYSSGLKTPGTIMLQPALFVQKFSDALNQLDNCNIYEKTAVTAFAKTKLGWQLQTDNAVVKAGKVILAVNGLVETFGFYKQQLMHINLYASMSRQLTDQECDQLGGDDEWGFTPSDPLGSTVRKINGTGGTRLLVRNRCTYESNLKLPANRLSDIAIQHDKSFNLRFPHFQNMEMEYRWSGRLCLSRNDAWAVDEVAPGMFSACCQNGLGLTRGTIAGIVASELALNKRDSTRIPDFELSQNPSNLIPEPFMTLGARSVLKFREWRAGREI